MIETRIKTGTIKNIIKETTDKRVSDEAAELLADLLSDEAVTIARVASKLCTHAGRNTITAEDIKVTVI
ncbi:MAG: hypothetical protein BZ136_09235 [Methanosphaera sp. rholeuAM74]|nr:MAG: hypothetical protein BZ136_09235 [Methanosphaera sp. rholeuAM74]